MKCRSCCLWNFHKENRKLSCPKTFFKMSSKTLNHVTLQMSYKQLYMNTKGEKKLRKTWLWALKQRMTVHPEKWGAQRRGRRGTASEQVQKGGVEVDRSWGFLTSNAFLWFFSKVTQFFAIFSPVIFLKTDSLFLICHFLNPSIPFVKSGQHWPFQVLWQLPHFLRYSAVLQFYL